MSNQQHKICCNKDGCVTATQVHLLKGLDVQWFSRQGHEHGAKSSYAVLDSMVRCNALEIAGAHTRWQE